MFSYKSTDDITFTSAWVSPDGRYYPVPDEEHSSFARERVPGNIVDPVTYLERLGWLHVSIGHDRNEYEYLFIEKTLTESQITYLFDLLRVTPGYRKARVMRQIIKVCPDWSM